MQRAWLLVSEYLHFAVMFSSRNTALLDSMCIFAFISSMYAAPMSSPAAQAKAVKVSEREAAGACGAAVSGHECGGMGEGQRAVG